MEQPLHVLLIEDDVVDQEMIIRCLKSYRHEFPVTVTPEATEALHILCGEAGHRPLPKPYIIVLDLSLPGIDGFEFLRRVRHDPDLKESVVIVLTGSASEQDQIRASHYHVTAYLSKDELGPYCTPLIALFKAYKQRLLPPHRNNR